MNTEIWFKISCTVLLIIAAINVVYISSPPDSCTPKDFTRAFGLYCVVLIFILIVA